MGIMKRIGSYILISILTFILTISVKALDLKNKFYNVEYNKDINPILIYEANGHLDLYDKNAEYNVTLEAKNNNGRYGIYISGKPLKSDGQVHFTGKVKDSYEIEINYDIVVNISRNLIKVTKTYNGVAGTNLGNILVYQVDNSDTLKPVNSSRNGITLKTANVNSKYGLYLMGTPENGGSVHFTGTVINEKNTYTIEYDITVNVANKTRQVVDVTKSYNGTVGKSIGDILVYQSNGKLGNISSTRNGLTLKTDTDGLRLSGTPTQAGTVTFTGTTYEGDDYTINFNITVNVPNPNKPQYKVEKLYNAVINKDIGKVLVYESTKTIPDIDKTEKGVNLKSENVDGKTKIYLSGKPTEEGQVIFSGSFDEGSRDLVYYLIINIKKSTTGPTNNNNTNNTNNNSNTNNTNNTNNGNNNNNDSNNNTIEEPTNNENIKEEPLVEEPTNEGKKEEPTVNPTPSSNKNTTVDTNEETKENNLLIPIIIGSVVTVGLLVSILVSKNKKKSLGN